MARATKSSEYAYILSWIQEAVEARSEQNKYVERAIKAFQGKPYANYYVQSCRAYADAVFASDPVKGAILKKQFDDIPNKGSFVVHNAIETIVASTMGGVGRFEFAPYDPEHAFGDRTADLLASAAKHFYHTEQIESLMPQAIRNAALSGSAWFHLKQRTDDGKKQVTLLETSQMITDPKRFKTNRQRYIGFQQREGFEALKKYLKKNKAGTVLSTLNEADVYMGQIRNQINRINGVGELNDSRLNETLSADLNLFYKTIQTQVTDLRKNDSDYTWNGDDVETTYLYDLMSDKYFIVINRRYVVSGKASDLHRTVKYKGTKWDKKENKLVPVDKTVTVKLEHPFVEVPYMKTHWDTFTISPLFYVLDDFDSLCAMESVFYHNLSIMGPATFVGQSADGELVSRVTSVAGEVIDGLPQTFGVLNKVHDMGPVTLGIQKYEDRIKRVMKATDPQELQAMIGDRATAKEVVGAMGQVSQGLNPFIANLETAMAEMGQKFIKLEIIYGNKDSFSFVHNGAYGELAAYEAAGTHDVVAKMASSVKLEQESNARKALELLQYLGKAEFMDKREFVGTMIPIVLTGMVNREQSMKMVGAEYKPMEEEVIAKIRARAEEEAKKHPIDKLDLNGLTDKDIDEFIAEFSKVGSDQFGDGTVPVDEGGVPVNPADQAMMQAAMQEVAATQNGQPPVPTGQDPTSAVATDPLAGADYGGIPSDAEAAGEIANDPTGAGYVA